MYWQNHAKEIQKKSRPICNVKLDRIRVKLRGINLATFEVNYRTSVACFLLGRLVDYVLFRIISLFNM